MRIIIAVLFAFPFFAQSQNMHTAWARQSLGDTSCYQQWSVVATDPSGYIYSAGSFFGPTIKFGNIVLSNVNTAGADMWLAKHDSLGNVIWAKGFGVVGSGAAGASAITTDLSGNVLLCGGISGGPLICGSDTLNSAGAFIMKLDAAGNVLWAIEGTGWSTFIQDIAVDEFDDIYVTGNCMTSFQLDTIQINPPPNVNAAYIIKIDKNGHPKWGVEMGDTNSYGATAYGIATDRLGHVYTCGTFLDKLSIGGQVIYDVPGNYDTYIAKFDYAGNILALRQEECANGDCYGTTMNCDKYGNLFLGGSFSGNSMQFGSSLVINTTGSGYSAMFIVKYDSTGNAVWAKGSNKQSFVNDVSTDKEGNVYASGALLSTSVILGTFNLTVPFNSPDPMFMVKYDSTGTVLYARLFQSGRDFNHIAPDLYGNVYVASDFNASFPMYIANDTLFSVSHRNFFLVRISDDLAAGIPDQDNFRNTLCVYPVPVTKELSVQAEKDFHSLSVYSATGELLYKDQVQKNQTHINFASYPAGIYVLQITDASGKIRSAKIIKTDN